MSPESRVPAGSSAVGIDEIRRRAIKMALQHTLNEACKSCIASKYATNQLSHYAIANGLSVRETVDKFLKQADPSACEGPSVSETAADPCRQEPIPECGHKLGGDTLGMMWQK